MAARRSQESIQRSGQSGPLRGPSTGSSPRRRRDCDGPAGVRKIGRQAPRLQGISYGGGTKPGRAFPQAGPFPDASNQIVRVLLDTCVLSELRRPKGHAGVRRAVDALADESLFVSVVSIGEIVKGISLLRDSQH